MVLLVVICCGIPIAGGIWAIATLQRIHAGQKRIESRLEEIAFEPQNRLPQ